MELMYNRETDELEIKDSKPYMVIGITSKEDYEYLQKALSFYKNHKNERNEETEK